MTENSKRSMKEVASKLEAVYEEVLKTQGFTAQTEKLRALVELVKEQVPNENSGS